MHTHLPRKCYLYKQRIIILIHCFQEEGKDLFTLSHASYYIEFSTVTLQQCTIPMARDQGINKEKRK